MDKRELYKNRYVIQKNELLEGNTTIFAAEDLKVYKLLISKVDSKNILFEESYTITTKELEGLNLPKKHLFAKATNILKKLANIYIKIEKGNKLHDVGVIQNSFIYERFKDTIEYSFHPTMKQYLLDIQNNYTKYLLADIVDFKYKHTIKLYEYCKRINLNVVTLNMDTFRNKMELEDKYQRWADFKNRVLDVSVDEINTKSYSIQLKYSPVKTGKNVTGITFYIKRNEKRLLENKSGISKLPEKFREFDRVKCIYEDKIYVLDFVDEENFKIILLENENKLNNREILFESYNEMIDELNLMFLNKNTKSTSNYNNSSIETLQTFKARVIEEYKNKEISNNIPFLRAGLTIGLDHVGYIINFENGKRYPKETAYDIWTYLFTNRDAIGKILDVPFELQYAGKKILASYTDQNGNQIQSVFTIDSITESEDEKGLYYLYLDDGIEIKKSKVALSKERIIENIKN